MTVWSEPGVLISITLETTGVKREEQKREEIVSMIVKWMYNSLAYKVTKKGNETMKHTAHSSIQADFNAKK